MRLLAVGALLYGLAAAGANPGANAVAGTLSAADRAALDTLRQGDMQKLVLHEQPRPRMDETFSDGTGKAVSLSDFEGKVVLLNLWATWCAPCRAEMPSIDRLAAEMAGDDLAVIALSTDRAGVDRVRDFFAEIGVTQLPVYLDQRSEMLRAAGALGLPVTLILDREGREIGRVTGDAEWDSPEAKALLSRLIGLTAATATEKAEGGPAQSRPAAPAG